MQASLCCQLNTRWSHSSKPSLCSFVLYSSSAWLSPLFISAFVKRHLWTGRCTRCQRGAAADDISAAYSQITVRAWCAFDSYRALQVNRSCLNDWRLRLIQLLPKFAATLQQTIPSVRRVKSTWNMAADNSPYSQSSPVCLMDCRSPHIKLTKLLT